MAGKAIILRRKKYVHVVDPRNTIVVCSKKNSTSLTLFSDYKYISCNIRKIGIFWQLQIHLLGFQKCFK